MKFFERIFASFSTFRLADLIDILMLAFIIYNIVLLVKQTRAEQLLKGILVLLVFAHISSILNLYVLNWLINNLFTVGLMFIIVVFQPEFRTAFERLGRGNPLFKSFVKMRGEQSNHKADEIVRAVSSLSRQKIGALIVIESEIGLSDIRETGTDLNAKLSSELLINIFIPNTPLHDGAVIIKEDKILSAGCFLPLSNDITISKELGTRHRAGLGISERSDALVIIVSEETGIISIVEEAKISRRIDPEMLKDILYRFFEKETQGLFSILGGSNENIKK